MTKREALRAVPMFRGLEANVLDRVLEHCIERTYPRGATVFVEGETTRGLFVVWKGRVKIYKVAPGGREQILEVEGPGRSIAELPMFDGLPYPAGCAALEDSILLRMPADRFHELVAREPALARSVISALSRRLRHMVALVEEISLKAVRERLGRLLLQEAGGRTTMELRWTHHEIAARIGTVREIVSRTLSRLSQEGAIRIDGKRLSILDARALAPEEPPASERDVRS